MRLPIRSALQLSSKGYSIYGWEPLKSTTPQILKTFLPSWVFGNVTHGTWWNFTFKETDIVSLWKKRCRCVKCGIHSCAVRLTDHFNACPIFKRQNRSQVTRQHTWDMISENSLCHAPCSTWLLESNFTRLNHLSNFSFRHSFGSVWAIGCVIVRWRKALGRIIARWCYGLQRVLESSLIWTRLFVKCGAFCSLVLLWARVPKGWIWSTSLITMYPYGFRQAVTGQWVTFWPRFGSTWNVRSTTWSCVWCVYDDTYMPTDQRMPALLQCVGHQGRGGEACTLADPGALGVPAHEGDDWRWRHPLHQRATPERHAPPDLGALEACERHRIDVSDWAPARKNLSRWNSAGESKGGSREWLLSRSEPSGRHWYGFWAWPWRWKICHDFGRPHGRCRCCCGIHSIPRNVFEPSLRLPIGRAALLIEWIDRTKTELDHNFMATNFRLKCMDVCSISWHVNSTRASFLSSPGRRCEKQSREKKWYPPSQHGTSWKRNQISELRKRLTGVRLRVKKKKMDASQLVVREKNAEPTCSTARWMLWTGVLLHTTSRNCVLMM